MFLISSQAHALDLEQSLEEKDLQYKEAKKKFDETEAELKNRLAAQADELDVAKAKASQLFKTQAKLNKLKVLIFMLFVYF